MHEVGVGDPGAKPAQGSHSTSSRTDGEQLKAGGHHLRSLRGCSATGKAKGKQNGCRNLGCARTDSNRRTTLRFGSGAPASLNEFAVAG